MIDWYGYYVPYDSSRTLAGCGVVLGRCGILWFDLDGPIAGVVIDVIACRFGRESRALGESSEQTFSIVVAVADAIWCSEAVDVLDATAVANVLHCEKGMLQDSCFPWSLWVGEGRPPTGEVASRFVVRRSHNGQKSRLSCRIEPSIMFARNLCEQLFISRRSILVDSLRST